MNLPRAVVEAERRAEEAFQQLQSSRQPQQDPAPAGVNQTPTAPAPAPTTPPPATAAEETWEARYKTLNGKYNAEVPRLHAALKERDAKLNGLTEEVEALKRTVNPLVRPEEIQEYGEPMIDMIRRTAREELASSTAEVKDLKAKVDKFETATATNTEASFYERLVALVPDWMAINDNPAFHSWLSEYDDFTGFQRQSLISEAEGKRDADRVAKFFNAFKEVQSKTAASATDSLESQVPPESTGATSPSSDGKKFWTRAEVADFYARHRRNEFTEEEAAAIDSEIQVAVRQNRIR